MRKTIVNIHTYPDAKDASNQGFSDPTRQQQIATSLEALFNIPGQFSIEVHFPGPVPQAAQSTGIEDAKLLADMQRCIPPNPRPDWFARILIAHSSVRGLNNLGVIFDTQRRDGCAVFTQAIQETFTSFDPLLIRTLAHELGHVFNLAHEDGEEEAQVDGTFEIMRPGLPTANSQPAFSAFCKSHLTGHDDASVQPGHSGFLTRSCSPHPVAFLNTGSVVERQGSSSRKVELRMHVHSGTVYWNTRTPTFVIGEPIHVSLELVNRSRRDLLMPCDPSTADQDLVLLRSEGSLFTNLLPPLLFCATRGKTTWKRLEPSAQASIHETLLFRNGSLIFPAEGKYKLLAGLRLQKGYIWSKIHEVRVTPPLKPRQESSCHAAAEPQAGLFVEMGGAERLGPEHESLRRLQKNNPGFPLNDVVKLLLGRNSVLAPGRTPDHHRTRLRQISMDKRLPRFVRSEARMLLDLDRLQEGELRSSASLERRLLEGSIPHYPATLIRKRLAERAPAGSDKEKSR